MLSRSSSTSNLRRSSILKPPKSRQPFQDLDFNASSPENSPESTKRRRVSFAEKKHVKEFCDLKEQGTIWDNTYEEADQNVSKSIETANENTGNNDPQIEYCQNLDSPTEGAGFDLLGSKSYSIMDPNSTGNSPTKRSFDPSADVEPNYVIPRSDDALNEHMSRTIYCEDNELDITEAIGGIEPTVSVRKIVGFESSHEIEKTMIFENSESDMKFTQIVSGRKIEDSTALNLPDLEIDKINSFAENRTIIFEDSTMDLTLQKSHSSPGLDPIQSTRINDSTAPSSAKNRMNDYLGSDYPESNYRAAQASNKTIFFNDIDCDITKPIDSIIRRLPRIDSAISNETPAEFRETSGNEGIKTGIDSSPKISHESNCNAPESSDKTIFFNDIGCEMTEAIDSLRPRLDRDENIEAKKSDQIVPYQSPEINPIRDESAKTEASRSRIPFPSYDTGETEFRLESKAEDNDRTESLSESAMDFTTAITRTTNHISEQNIIGMKPESNIDKHNEYSNTDMSFTKIVISEIHRNENERLSENLESTESQQCCNSLIDQNSECDINLTETVEPAAPDISNSNQNLEDENSSLNFVLSPTDQHGNKKRKFVELTEEVEASKRSYSLPNKSSEHEFSLVQSLTHDKTSDLTNNCKRSKAVNCNTTANCEQTDNFSINLLSSIPLSKTCEVQEVQSAISTDVTTANDCTTDSINEYPLHDEDTSLTCAQNSHERSTVEEIIETKTEIESIEDIDAQEEPSLFDAISDEDEEVQELVRVYQKQSISRIESNNEQKNSSESDSCLENNDDCCFVMFKEGLKEFSKSDNCIWKIRSVDTKRVLIDFISKSLVVVINLEANKELTAPPTIEEIKFVSLLSDSEQGDIAMVHDILLKKLNPEQLKQQYRTTQDILSLLEFISQKVKLLMDFMYELDKQRDFHLINRLKNRISFRLHSYKIQLAIKITIDIEPFEDVGPNDVTVECILGSIREKDIKQLISSVKKDHKFLTNYINDIKEYVALVLEK